MLFRSKQTSSKNKSSKKNELSNSKKSSSSKYDNSSSGEDEKNDPMDDIESTIPLNKYGLATMLTVKHDNLNEGDNNEFISIFPHQAKHLENPLLTMRSQSIRKDLHIKFGKISPIRETNYLARIYTLERIFNDENSPEKCTDELKISVLFFAFIERLLMGRGEGFYFRDFSNTMRRCKNIVLFKRLDAILDSNIELWWKDLEPFIDENEENSLQDIINNKKDLLVSMSNFAYKVTTFINMKNPRTIPTIFDAFST